MFYIFSKKSILTIYNKKKFDSRIIIKNIVYHLIFLLLRRKTINRINQRHVLMIFFGYYGNIIILHMVSRGNVCTVT
jgi:hypothetical protein